MIEANLYVYLLIGMILLCLFCAIIYKSRRTKRLGRTIINVLLVVCFSLLMAFRPDVVPDTQSYEQIFSNIKTNKSYGFDIFGEAERVEYGFLYLIKFYKFFSDDVRLFFFLVCIISVSIFLFGMNKIVLKLTKHKMCVPFVFAVYISYFGIYYNGIAIRQGLALALCMLSFSFFLNKKYIRGIISWLLAFLFHRLSLIFLIIMLIYKILGHLRISLTRNYLIAIVCLVCALFGLGYVVNQYIFGFVLNILGYGGLGSAYSHYLTNLNSSSGGFPLYLIFQIIIGIVLIYLSGKRKYANKLLNIYLIGIVMMTVLVGTFAINRGIDYFLIFSILIIGCCAIVPKTRPRVRRKKGAEVATRGQCVYVCRKIGFYKILLIAFVMLGYFLAVLNIMLPEFISLNILH